MRRYCWLTIFFLWLAFLWRVWGISFGLPYKFHPDEHKYVDAALAWHTTGQMDLKLINPPFFTYVLWVVDWFWLALSPYAPTETWLTGVYVFARLWSVVLAMSTICLAYTIAKRLGRHQAGLVALILLSSLFLPAREAHFAVNDSAVTFMVLLTLYFCLRLLQAKRLFDYAAVGITAGLATAAKLTGGLVIISVLITYGFQQDKKYRSLGLSLGLALLTFGLVSAHILWQLPQFIATIGAHLDFGAEGYKGLQMTPLNGWLFYGQVLAWGVGWALLVVIGLALIKNIAHPTPSTLVLMAFPIVMFGYMGVQKIVFARFLLPAIPPLVILAAISLVEVGAPWLWRQRYPRLVFAGILGLFLWQPLANLIWFDHLLTLPDTRQLATTWFTGQFPPGTTVARESYSILPNTVFLDKEWPYQTDSLGGNNQLKGDIDYYLTQPAKLMVVSNFTSGRVYEDAATETLRLKQLARLDQEAILLKEFNPYQPTYNGRFYLDELYGPAGETLQRLYPGPSIRIYQLKSEGPQ